MLEMSLFISVHFYFYRVIFISSVITVQYCSDPGAIENGEMEGNGPFNCVSTVKYTCNQGYWLLGAEILKCGIDGQWNHGKPSCMDKSKSSINKKAFQ